MTNSNEGPHLVKIPANSFNTCGGCKWLKREMIHSGRNPKYYNRCSFKEIPTEIKYINTKELEENEHGYVLTPDWCPVKPLPTAPTT